MFNEDLKYLIRSTLITILPVFGIIILTEYILDLILSRNTILNYVDIAIRSVFFSQTIGIFNLFKYQKGNKRRDEIEKIVTLRIIALNVLLYLVGVILLMFLLGYLVNILMSQNYSLTFITEKVVVNIVFLSLISLYKLKISRDIIQR